MKDKCCHLVWRTCWNQHVIKIYNTFYQAFQVVWKTGSDCSWLGASNFEKTLKDPNKHSSRNVCRFVLVCSLLECIVTVPALHGKSLDVFNLGLSVPVVSSDIAIHSSQQITEVRQPPSPLSLSLSLSFSASPLSPLYLSHSSLWSMPGACAVGASVFGCVFVSVQLRLWTCYHVYFVLVRRAHVFVCVHTRLAMLWSPMQCCLWTEELCMTEAGVKAARAFSW